MLSNEINILSVATCITIGHLSYQREQISSLLIHANYKLVSTLQICENCSTLNPPQGILKTNITKQHSHDLSHD